MLADDVIQRLKEWVSHLEGRVEGLADLVQMQAENRPTQSPIAAHVVADGLTGGSPDAASGYYRQPFDETVSVLLTFRNMQGGRGLDLYDAVKWAVIEALCGWASENTVGVFRLVRGRTIRNEGGTLVYQIDFAIGDQLRIET